MISRTRITDNLVLGFLLLHDNSDKILLLDGFCFKLKMRASSQAFGFFCPCLQFNNTQ